MHESLTETLHLAVTVVAVSHHRKVGVHAGIPAAESLNTVAGVEVAYVIALAGGTYKRTGSAGQARFI